MRFHTLAVLLLLLVPPAASGQATTAPALQLRPDARVRLELQPPAAERFTARFVALQGDTLMLREAASPVVPLSTVQRLEVSRGRTRGRWLLLGAGVGLVGGVVYSRATLDDDPADVGGVQNTADGVANTILGMLLGGGAGYLLAPERWSEVPLPAPATRAR